MKSLLIALAIVFSSFAAFAGGVGCIPNAQTGNASIEPPTDSLDCINTGQFYNETIYIENFGSFAVGPFTGQVDSLVIDSITNIPCNMDYEVNPSDGVLETGETGCISLFGTTYDNVGQYRLNIYIHVYASVPGVFAQDWQGEASLVLDSIEQTLGQPLPIDAKYYLRVKDPGTSVCPDIDTTGNNDLIASASCLPPGGFTVDIVGDDEVCADSTTTLTLDINGSGVPPYTYAWTPTASLSSYSGAVAGNYSVTVTDDNGTTATASFTVSTLSPPTSSFTATPSGQTVTFVFTGTNATGGTWHFGDGNTAAGQDTAYTYTNTVTDTFTVLAIATNDCGVDTATQEVIVTVADTGTGIINRVTSELDFAIYPNPVQDVLMVNLKGANNATISIYSIQGALIKEVEVVGSDLASVNLSNQPTGTYLLSVKTAEGVAVRKILKQ